jgi:hypothetical protein
MDGVWQLVYQSFKSSTIDGFKSTTALNGAQNDVQLRLQRSIAGYRQQPSTELFRSIVGDVRISNAMGYISNETHDKIMNILDKEGMKWHLE